MTVQGHTFDTLSSYLEWLEQEWRSFEKERFSLKLYTLKDYLEDGRFMWTEVYCLPEEIL